MKIHRVLPLCLLIFSTSACAYDKNLHMAAGAVGGGATYLITKDRKAACLAAIGLGLGKEFYDSQGHGTVEVMDAVATAALPCLALTIRF